MQWERATLFLALVFGCYAGFFSRISVGRIMDIPPGLSSRPILDTRAAEVFIVGEF